MRTLRARSRKVIIGAFVAASLMLSVVGGFAADDASAMRCSFSTEREDPGVCYLPR